MPISIISLREAATTSPAVAVEYPQYPSLSTGFNERIASSARSRLADFRQESADNDAARRATSGSGAAIPENAYSFTASWQTAQANARYVSFIERYDSYSGGANERQEMETFAYDVANRKELALADLFPDSPDWLRQVSELSRRQLRSVLEDASNGNYSRSMLDEGTAPNTDNFRYFTFTDDAITVYFPKYAVAPGSFGEQKAVILRSAIR